MVSSIHLLSVVRRMGEFLNLKIQAAKFTNLMLGNANKFISTNLLESCNSFFLGVSKFTN